MKRSILTLTLAAAATLAVLPIQHAAALAQEKSAQPCQAQPHPQGRNLPETGDAPGRNRMADCNGVLEPPAVGDPELVRPAPDTGKMPVIPPSAIPGGGIDGGRAEPR